MDTRLAPGTRLRFGKIGFAVLDSPEHPPALTLEVISPQAASLGAGRRQTVRPPGITIGRSGVSDWVLPSPYIARQHARIRFEGGQFFLEVLGLSTVSVGHSGNVVPSHELRPLRAGDRIFIDEYEVLVALVDQEPEAIPGQRVDPAQAPADAAVPEDRASRLLAPAAPLSSAVAAPEAAPVQAPPAASSIVAVSPQADVATPLDVSFDEIEVSTLPGQRGETPFPSLYTSDEGSHPGGSAVTPLEAPPEPSVPEVATAPERPWAQSPEVKEGPRWGFDPARRDLPARRAPLFEQEPYRPEIHFGELQIVLIVLVAVTVVVIVRECLPLIPALMRHLRLTDALHV